jgi:pimeloyl-ACP methyl ester carboxylesterase
MMKQYNIVIILFMLFANYLKAQQQMPTFPLPNYNFDFERMDVEGRIPDKWIPYSVNKGYKIATDTVIRHGGKRSLSIEKNNTGTSSLYACMATQIPAMYMGKEVEVRAWIKIQDVSSFMGLMLRINDEDHNSLAFENLQKKKIKGTKDWTLYKIKLLLPKNAAVINVGPILAGTGKLWVDDVQVLIDGKDLKEASLISDYKPIAPPLFRYGSNEAAAGRLKLKDADLYYEIYGEGEPVLLLHGNSQSIYYLKYQIAELSKKFKVIAVDTRGQGRSKDFSTSPLTYDEFAADMKQLLDELKISKTHIVGWSDGGNTGLIMAIKYPQYVNKLAVMGAVLFPSEQSLGKKALKEIQRRLSQFENGSDAASKSQARLYHLLMNEPHLTFKEISTIQSPVLVMAGEKDVVLEPHTKAIAQHIPHAELLIFKDRTHYIPVENPDEFNSAILDFLK